MEGWLIIIVALWIFPVIAVITVRRLWLNKQLLKRLLLVFTASSLLVVVCMYLGISTSFSIVNWILFSSIYMTICLWFRTGGKHPNKWIKISIQLLTLIVWAIGYLSASLGALGIGFIVAECEPDVTQKVTNHIIYREYNLGNAISDWRGTRTSLYTTYTWLPFIEHKFFTKDYEDDVIDIRMQQQLNASSSKNKNNSKKGAFDVMYNGQKNMILLQSKIDDHKIDTIRLSN